MISFRVSDMTCGHCVSTITRAVKVIDREAVVSVDLGRHVVEIEPDASTTEDLRAAIVEAGYSPVAL